MEDSGSQGSRLRHPSVSTKESSAPRWPLEQLAKGHPPLAHYDPFGKPACECWLCLEWEKRICAAHEVSVSVSSHNRSCMCEVCRERRHREINLLIAENVRDIWTELCWCASEEQWDSAWVKWAMEELSDPSRSRGWWSSQSTHYPMAYWYARWDAWRKARGIAEHLRPVQKNMKLI